MTPGLLLLFFVPFLLSLFGGGRGHPRSLCFLCGIMAMLLSVEPSQALLPWGLGMLIAVVSLRERYCPPV